LERKQKIFASGLMPVADNFKLELVKSGVSEKSIRTVTCSVNTEMFAFSINERNNIRTQLGIHHSGKVGIYAGRYGGLYLEEEAVDLYQSMFDYFDHEFRLILLVPKTYHEWLTQQIKKRNLPENRIHIKEVGHEEVASYLSASDFALATYKSGKSMAYLSPVKIGEYWANGLPVFLTDGVGDETRIIRKHPSAGVLFQVEQMRLKGKEYLSQLKQLLSADRDNAAISNLAVKYRNPRQCISAYEYFLKGYK
jgi:hypothetical protein